MQRNSFMQDAFDAYWRETPDMAFIKDMHGVYQKASLAFAKANGWARAEDVVGKTDEAIFQDTSLVKRYTDDDARMLQTGQAFENYIEPYSAKDGRPRYCITSKYIMRDADGNATGIFGIGRDVTTAYVARQSYENELKSLFELPPHAPASVLFDITEWRVIEARRRDAENQVVSVYERIDDYIENVLGAIIDNEDALHFFRHFTREDLEREYANGRSSRSFEYERRMPDGSTHWVRDDIRFLLDPVTGHLSLFIILLDIDEQKRAYAKLIAAAERDTMTNLLNHDATIKCITDYLSEAKGLQALFMIDLDNFKQINDSFGHQYGDTILIKTGEAIRSVFRASDIVGRIGGDEFMVLMKDAFSEETVRQRAVMLISALQFFASDNARELALTTSVGITMFFGGELDFDSLYSEVDGALYCSKRDGKNRYTIFDRCRPPAEQKENVELPAPESVNTVQLRTLLENMDGGVVLAEVRDDIRITYVSPSLFRSFGRDINELGQGAQGIFTFVHQEDLPGLISALRRAAENGELLDYCYRVVYEGEIEWRRIRVKRIPESEDGVPRLVAVVTDITALQQANGSQAEAEERYRTAVEQMDAMLWEVDIPSRTMTRTGSAWDRFNRGVVVFPDAPESYIRTGMVHPDSIDRLRTLFRDLYAGNDRESYFLRLCAENGEEVWVKDRFKLLRDDEGTPYRALGITQLVPNINMEMQSFEQEVRFAKIVQDSLLGYLHANFTQGVMERVELNDDGKIGIAPGADLKLAVRTVLETLIDEADREELAQQISTEYLLAWFREGKSWKFVDFRRITTEGSRRWTSLFIKLMRHPLSGDVYAFCYVRDNEARRTWELTLGRPVTRNATLLLYSQEAMEALSAHIIATSREGQRIAVSVFELLGLERVRREQSEQEAKNLLFTFGRICRIAIGGDTIIGQVDENRVALLRADAGSNEAQRERVMHSLRMLKSLLHEAHPRASVDLVGGFATAYAGKTTYAQLLHRADIACRSAAQTVGESAVAYADMGVQPEEENAADLAERYRALELRYQQQANMLRVSENDELTGIPGKQAFYRRVRETLDTHPETQFVLVRFDINRFKVFNDVRGIAAGDKLLLDIATKMRKNVEEQNACCGRLSSDHFAVLTEDDDGKIRRSVETLADWLAGYDHDFRLSATAGVYRITDTTLDVSFMCDRALLAQRSVKSGFDTRFAYYNYTLRHLLINEQQLVGDMENALLNDQFLLYFQPQVNYENGMLIGAEALVRWNHPQRGLLSPSVFIPLFEKNGLIMRLDEYVWDRCCRYIREWNAKYPQARALSLSVSVNVSRIDIYDERLCGMLQRLMEKYELPPKSLRLEITESAYMENPKQLIETVHTLQKMGFVIEMDDFGSGYSSLNTLKDVTVDVLKLDMKFLDACTDSARGGNILSSVIRMAHWLRLPIIAEGVQTKTQADYLKSLGCVYMQGYYFGRPMPAEDFEKLLISGASSLSTRYTETNFSGMAAFWDPSTQMTLLFNSFVGGAAIMEYRNGLLEVSRANDNFYKALGTTREQFLPEQTNLAGCFDPENWDRLTREMQIAMESGEERDFELALVEGKGGVTRPCIFTRMRLLARSDDCAILYISIENITDRKRMEREQAAEKERDQLLMQTTGLAFFDYHVDDDVFTYQIYLPERGITRRVVPQYTEFLKEGGLVDRAGAATILRTIEGIETMGLGGEFEYRANLWNNGMRWCRARYVGVQNANGRVYRLVGQINDIQDIRDREAIAEALRNKLHGDSASYSFNSDVTEQIFSLFYEAADVEKAIHTTLAFLGETYDLSRAYIFEDSEDHTAMSNTYEWCAPDVPPQRAQLQNLPYEEIGGRAEYIAKFNEDGIFYCPDVRKMSARQRAVLEPQGIFSMLHYAIRDGGAYTGIIGFDECRENRRWTDEQVGTLRFVSRIVAMYLCKLRWSERCGGQLPGGNA